MFEERAFHRLGDLPCTGAEQHRRTDADQQCSRRQLHDALRLLFRVRSRAPAFAGSVQKKLCGRVGEEQVDDPAPCRSRPLDHALAVIAVVLDVQSCVGKAP